MSKQKQLAVGVEPRKVVSEITLYPAVLLSGLFVALTWELFTLDLTFSTAGRRLLAEVFLFPVSTPSLNAWKKERGENKAGLKQLYVVSQF